MSVPRLFLCVLCWLLVACGQEGATPFEQTLLNGIKGGSAVHAESRPWVVLFSYHEQDLCSGSIVAARFILTAAHCFYQLNLDLKTVLVKGGGDGQRAHLVDLPAIKTVHLHPDYRGGHTTARDLALVELVAPLKFSKSLQAITIRNMAGANIRPMKVSIAGWGFTDSSRTRAQELTSITVSIERTVDLTPTSPARAKVIELFQGPEIYTITDSPKTTCGGDSGTGWTMELLGGHQLVAVHSSGDCHGFAVAAELSGGLPWVYRVLRGSK